MRKMLGKIKTGTINTYLASKCVINTILKGERAKRLKAPDKDILIVGNGPSLKEVDLLRFVGKVDFCCVNYFPCKDDNFFRIKPKYICMIDPIFYSKEGGSLTTAWRLNDIERIRKLEEELMKVDWPICFLTKQGYSLEINNPYITYERLSASVFLGRSISSISLFERDSKWNFWLFDKNFAVPGYACVVCTALLYFTMCRSRRIILAGCDNSYFFGTFVDERNHVMCHPKHFYEEEKLDLTERGMVGEHGFPFLMEQHMGAFVEFYKISKYAQYKKVPIINTSLQSYIDVFEKRSWEDVLRDYD